MSCLFCETFAHYERQIARRLRSNSFALSEENARHLISMAAQIRNLTRTTLRHVDNEVVPTMLCDLFEGLAEGLIEELAHKLARPGHKNGQPLSPPSNHSYPNGERNARQAG
jgi:hypothetical protein